MAGIFQTICNRSDVCRPSICHFVNRSEQLCKHRGECRVKVRFRFDLAAWAIEFSSSAVDAVLRCLYSQPLDIVSL